MSHPSLQFLADLVQYIPYVGMVTRKEDKDSRMQPLVTRLVEASIPGIAVALIFMYSSGQMAASDIAALKSQMYKVQEDQTRILTKLAEVTTELRVKAEATKK